MYKLAIANCILLLIAYIYLSNELGVFLMTGLAIVLLLIDRSNG